MEYEDIYYVLLTDRNQFTGTDYMEFLPGKFSGKHWNDDSVFLYEDSMDVIHDLSENANSEYDHYDNTYFNNEQIDILIGGLSARLAGIKNDKDYKISEEVYHAEQKNKTIKEYRTKIIKMLEDLIAWISANRADGISVLGI